MKSDRREGSVCQSPVQAAAKLSRLAFMDPSQWKMIIVVLLVVILMLEGISGGGNDEVKGVMVNVGMWRRKITGQWSSKPTKMKQKDSEYIRVNIDSVRAWCVSKSWLKINSQRDSQFAIDGCQYIFETYRPSDQEWKNAVDNPREDPNPRQTSNAGESSNPQTDLLSQAIAMGHMPASSKRPRPPSPDGSMDQTVDSDLPTDLLSQSKRMGLQSSRKQAGSSHPTDLWSQVQQWKKE